MKKLAIAVMVAVMLFGTIAISYADREDWRGGIRTRIHEAQERIERGSLTRHEAKRLNEELDRILDKIEHMKADGRLNPREREIINRDLNRLDRDISREKHDRERRPR
jgi:hypothetical protein